MRVSMKKEQTTAKTMWMSGLCTVKIKWNLTGYRYQLWHHCSRVLSHSPDCDKMNLNIIVVSANVIIHINASIQCVCASVYGNWINAIEISFLCTRENVECQWMNECGQIEEPPSTSVWKICTMKMYTWAQCVLCALRTVYLLVYPPAG